MSSVNHLHKAWEVVRQKQSAGGVDGQSISAFSIDEEKELTCLSEELKAGKWIPEPYLRVDIKKNELEKRHLGLLSVRDKIVQQAIKMAIEPLFENRFIESSFGYRPNRGTVKAIRKVQSIIEEHHPTCLVKIDIDNFFDTVDHSKLLQMVGEWIEDRDVVHLIDLCMRMGVVNAKLKWSDTTAGVPQGGLCITVHKPPYA